MKMYHWVSQLYFPDICSYPSEMHFLNVLCSIFSKLFLNILLLMFRLQKHLDIPIVKQHPNRLPRAGVGHTEVHQQHQTGIRGVEKPHFQVEGFPQQHLQGLVILRVEAAVLRVWDEGCWVRRRLFVKHIPHTQCYFSYS